MIKILPGWNNTCRYDRRSAKWRPPWNPGCITITALLEYNEGDSYLVLTLWTVKGALKSVPPCRRKPHAVVRASRCRLTWHSMCWLGIALGRVHAVRNATSPWRRHRHQIPLQPGPEVEARPRLRVIDTAAKTRSTVIDPSRSENAVGMLREIAAAILGARPPLLDSMPWLAMRLRIPLPSSDRVRSVFGRTLMSG